MSLKRFVQRPDVCQRLKMLRPVGTRRIGQTIKVTPQSLNPQLVGTAFDYLLRFELERRVKFAESSPWVAEYATNGAPGFTCRELEAFGSIDAVMARQERQTRAIRRVISNAKHDIAEYRRKRKPKLGDYISLAAHAIRLAKLDEVYRAGDLKLGFTEADEVDIKELVDLLMIVPFENLTTCKRLLLNPKFGDASPLVGGADADLIVDDLIIDLKTTKRGSIKSDQLDQLLGYFILARKARRLDPCFPEIKRLGFYFSRYGSFWIWDVSKLCETPEFLAAEIWFLDEAGKRFLRSRRWTPPSR